MGCAGSLEDLLQGPDMIGVPVGGQHRGDGHTGILGHLQDRRGIIGGVDEQPLIARGQKVTVVVHLGHGNAVQFKLVGHAGQSSEISLFVGMFEGIAFIGFISPHTISEGQLSKWLIAS